jgi:hypothetical protein
VVTVREGANHTIVLVNGNMTSVPATGRSGEGLAHAIVKQAKGEK